MTHSVIMIRVCAVLSILGLAWACDGSQRERGATGHRAVRGVPLTVVTRRDSARTADEKLSRAMRSQLAEVPFGTQLEVVVDLRDQIDSRGLAAEVAVRARTRRERRTLVVEVARRLAETSQQPLQRTLDSLTAAGAVEAYRGFTVVNRLVVRGTPEAVRVLAQHPDVAAILTGRADDMRVDTPTVRARNSSRRLREPRADSRPWAVRAVGADSAWRLGLSGAGTVVGIIDAGASGAHEQLRQNFRGGAASWYDPHGGTRFPTDALAGHGTGILSLAVGRAPPGGDSIGVAPGAQWVACVGLPEGRYNVVSVTECAEWIFATAQPDVVINPWLIADVSCDRSLEAIVNAWRAAEILPVFAAGNEGPAPGTGGSPANYVDLYPGAAVALSVGGLRRDRTAYARSSRGPNRCNGGVYPVVAAPGEDITVAYPLSPTMYVRTAGTSYAAGVVAGAVALLLERHPDATVSELEEALRSGARDLGRPGADHEFGFGSLDVPRAIGALDRIRARAPGLHDVRANR